MIVRAEFVGGARDGDVLMLPEPRPVIEVLLCPNPVGLATANLTAPIPDGVILRGRYTLRTAVKRAGEMQMRAEYVWEGWG